jgi:hypothetical protein
MTVPGRRPARADSSSCAWCPVSLFSTARGREPNVQGWNYWCAAMAPLPSCTLHSSPASAGLLFTGTTMPLHPHKKRPRRSGAFEDLRDVPPRRVGSDIFAANNRLGNGEFSVRLGIAHPPWVGPPPLPSSQPAHPGSLISSNPVSARSDSAALKPHRQQSFMHEDGDGQR